MHFKQISGVEKDIQAESSTSLHTNVSFILKSTTVNHNVIQLLSLSVNLNIF